jgi:hypothetical protein
MDMHADLSAEDAIFRVGKVIAVKGRSIEVKVDKTKNSSHLIYKGELLKNVSVGGYLKIMKGFTTIIGKVEGEQVTEDKAVARNQGYRSDRSKISRVLNVSLLGFFKGRRFERGIKELPLIDNECFLLHKFEFEQVHNFIQPKDEPLEIGALSFEKGLGIRVGVNGLFASHIGIFGNTGSGKSYTLAKLYRELFGRYKDEAKFRENSRFFLIDLNGEYIDGDLAAGATDDIIIEQGYKNTYRLSTRAPTGVDRFPIPLETLKDSDFWVVFLEATEKTQTPFLRRAVDSKFLAPKIKDQDQLKAYIAWLIFTATTGNDRNIDKAVVTNFITELRDALNQNPSVITLLNDYRTNLQYHSGQFRFFYRQANGLQIFSDNPAFETTVVNAKVAQLAIDTSQLTEIDEIRLQIVIQYYDDIIRGFANKEHLAPLIKRLDQRIDDLKKVIAVRKPSEEERARNFTIVSLKDVNVHMRKILPLLMCKNLYLEKKAEGDDRKYLNIIVDEAHNVLSENSKRESEQWKDYRLETFEEIVKEGRKFGVFLTIASQRPSDISPTIISQLHNYFLHRLINNEDINAVRQTIAYLDKVSFDYLPLLPTGTCIFAGMLANVPIVLDIAKIEPPKHEPKNKTITLVDKWA